MRAGALILGARKYCSRTASSGAACGLSNVAFRSLDVLARFEPGEPGVGLFLHQVQAGGLVVIPGCEGVLKKLLAS